MPCLPPFEALPSTAFLFGAARARIPLDADGHHAPGQTVTRTRFHSLIQRKANRPART